MTSHHLTICRTPILWKQKVWDVKGALSWDGEENGEIRSVAGNAENEESVSSSGSSISLQPSPKEEAREEIRVEEGGEGESTGVYGGWTRCRQLLFNRLAVFGGCKNASNTHYGRGKTPQNDTNRAKPATVTATIPS